jgi:eukaryotic-like serine/threonine-protein kinase
MGAEGAAAARASAVQRYRFVRRLAVGGMAEIYVADAIGVAGVNKRVALKRILPNLANDVAFVTMFLREARIASTLQHPSIVQTYDVIDDAGEYYISMELLEGIDLLELRQRLFERQRAPTPAQVLYVLDRILSGLHYAHERGAPDGRPMNLVHRDLSPHNVFLTRGGNVKLLDFGVAKVEAAFGREVTESGVVKGKVLYMSPEQCQGLEVDRTSDIYAAGVLMYILLTGKHPFRGTNPYDTMRAVIHDTPPLPSSVVPSLGPEVDDIVMQAMNKAPAARFQTAREMQQALARVVRERGWYVTDLDFAAFVESLMDQAAPDPDTRNLPGDLVIGDLVVEEPVEHDERLGARDDHVVAETEHALVERVRGLTLLTLRGAIDERFDPAIARHLRGVVLIDTEDVTRVTSYGIRALLEVIEASAPVVDAVFHVRCSVAFVQQVNMIRRLLAGGQVVSFHLPYVDPVTDQPFQQTVSGHHAALILRARQPPPAACPGNPERQAEFDEDAESYLDFADDFCPDPPAHVRFVIEALAVKEKRRQVEKEITPDGLVVYIRRPIDDAFRWRTLLAGVEGAVRIDLDATPTWTDPGLDRLVAAVSSEAHNMASLELNHMPLALYERVRCDPKLGPLLHGGSVRVHALCPHCGAPRRIAVELGSLTRVRAGPVQAPCPSCGRPLDVLRALTEPEAASRESAPVPARSRRLVWAVGLSGLVLMTLTVLLLVALGLHLRT